MAGPLEGIRILDWSLYQMGPVATAMLADLGASVIHIENRISGDPGRGLKFIYGTMDNLPYERCSFFECNNRGKKSITLDLQTQKGKEVLYRSVFLPISEDGKRITHLIAAFSYKTTH